MGAFQKVRLAGELLLNKTVKAKSSPKARAKPQAAGSFKGPAVKKAAAKGPQRLASLHEESQELGGFFRSLGKAAQSAPDQASSAPSNGPELLLKLRQARRLRGQARLDFLAQPGSPSASQVACTDAGGGLPEPGRDQPGGHHLLKMVAPCGSGACYPSGNVDCQMSMWDEWSPCTARCGAGSKTRERRVISEALAGGHSCEGPLKMMESCQVGQCNIVDCRWGEWASWSDCSCECGGGTKRRTRAVMEAPRNGGASCQPQAMEEAFPCNTQPCGQGCVDGQWGAWGSWTECSATCASSYRSRSRNLDIQPSACGKAAGGPRDQFELCTDLPPCVQDTDCELHDWGQWSHCSCHCFGIRERNRYISHFATGNGKACKLAALKADADPLHDQRLLLEDVIYSYLTAETTRMGCIRDSQDKGIIHVGKQGGVFSKDTVEQNFEFLCDFYATLAPVIPPLSIFKAASSPADVDKAIMRGLELAQLQPKELSEKSQKGLSAKVPDAEQAEEAEKVQGEVAGTKPGVHMKPKEEDHVIIAQETESKGIKEQVARLIQGSPNTDTPDDVLKAQSKARWTTGQFYVYNTVKLLPDYKINKSNGTTVSINKRGTQLSALTCVLEFGQAYSRSYIDDLELQSFMSAEERSGGPSLRKSGEYPRQFAIWVVEQHMRCMAGFSIRRKVPERFRGHVTSGGSSPHMR
ncbi:unnamed protein product [Effrenium voratum]|nr:unnamed protein product [Effrenium voratum]